MYESVLTLCYSIRSSNCTYFLNLNFFKLVVYTNVCCWELWDYRGSVDLVAVEWVFVFLFHMQDQYTQNMLPNNFIYLFLKDAFRAITSCEDRIIYFEAISQPAYVEIYRMWVFFFFHKLCRCHFSTDQSCDAILCGLTISQRYTLDTYFTHLNYIILQKHHFCFYNGCVLLCKSVAWYSHVLFIFRIAKSRLYLSKGNTRNYEWIRTLTCYLCKNVGVAWMLDIFWLLVRMRTRKACKYRASLHSFINYLPLPSLYLFWICQKRFLIVYRCYLYMECPILSQLTILFVHWRNFFLLDTYIYLYLSIFLNVFPIFSFPPVSSEHSTQVKLLTPDVMWRLVLLFPRKSIPQLLSYLPIYFSLLRTASLEQPGLEVAELEAKLLRIEQLEIELEVHNIHNYIRLSSLRVFGVFI